MTQLMFKFLSLLTNGQGMDFVIIKVLKKTNTFGLIGQKGVSSLLAFGLKKMNKMFNCLINRCHEIKTIVYGNETSKVALNVLKIEPTSPTIDQTAFRSNSSFKPDSETNRL